MNFIPDYSNFPFIWSIPILVTKLLLLP
ncbi:UDP-3-O-[3-hydroxymyristoyl] N-acetylglucosamine deacetylase [Crocosphaera chwakensis CCY0110]|uniref:UDP-3-O-[3-hydroxymyristoyl] N-acetylglucosamine deacetylase n=1 Tax=Crocosphaera chwakensis CCY0110 TaxID=391612 RepID=A3IHE0_9CHRO|nr:UDP-3-O-[3-hydroxymyristoyl] N-acetylglucosamine deacetylase [Crocosphaera chwakensis CCY0110]